MGLCVMGIQLPVLYPDFWLEVFCGDCNTILDLWEHLRGWENLKGHSQVPGGPIGAE